MESLDEPAMQTAETIPLAPDGTELRSLPELHERILHSMTEGVTVTDETGTILYTNPAEDRMFGYEPGELLGRHVSVQNAYPPEENMRLVAAVVEQLKTTGSWTGEWLNRRKDGTQFQTFARITSLNAGPKRYFVCVQEDISDRKRAEEELQRRSEELTDFIENASVGLHWVAPDGTILWANRAELDLLGYKEEEYIGRKISDFHADPALIEDILRRLESGEEVRDQEAGLKAKDGSVKYVLISSNVYSKNGKFVHTRCFTRDITHRKLAEEALTRLGAVVESSDDAIIAKDLDGTIRSWNRGAERIFGYTADEIIGRNISTLAAPHCVYEVPKILARVARGEKVDHYETQRRRKDGQIITVSLTISPVRDSRGNIIGASKIARDVTERRNTERALRELENQVMLLVEASSALLTSPQSSEVMGTIVSLAQRFVAADAYSVWRRNEDGIWRLAASAGLSEEYVATAAIAAPSSEGVPAAPVIVDDVTAEPLLAGRRESLAREGVRSMLVIPLRTDSQSSSTVVFYWKTPHSFTEREVHIASALGNLAGSALRTADLYARQLQLRAEAEASERRAAFLAEAGAALASSLDHKQTLAGIAELSVPGFADWASVDLLENDRVRRVSVAHKDPDKVALAYELTERYPPGENDVLQVALRTGKSVLIGEIQDEMLVDAARDPDHLRLIRELGLRSAIAVPMVLNGRSLGMITFVTAESGRRYTAADLQTAEELARRASTALDHARLFAESQAAQTALRRSNTELRRANADLEQFAYSASHDLQEPLRMVAVYSQMLSRKYRGKMDPHADEYLGYMVEGARRMESLIRDLLAYTQVVSMSENQNAPVDAERVLEQVLLNLRGAIEENHAQVNYDRLPRLLVNEVHLMQLFQNLIGNAIKYRGDKPPVVEVTASEERNMWRICVRDNGIGIDPRFANQIFGIFKRLHGSDRYGGTGIGLAICQKIVHRYGGRIWVDSAGEGQGSQFCFTLPGAG